VKHLMGYPLFLLLTLPPLAANVDCSAGPPSGGDGTVATTDADHDGSPMGTDCDDQDPLSYPGAEEIPDGRDNDCNGLADDGVFPEDADGDGFSRDEGDCDDTDPSVYPGADEVVDGNDNDCDGISDNTPAVEDADGDGISIAEGDCDDQDPAIAPGVPDVADGVDNDCDGLVDEPCDGITTGCVSTCVDDYDGDGYSEEECDCHDGRADVFPGNTSPDLANGVDDDCDGVEGEDDPSHQGGPEPTSGPVVSTVTPFPGVTPEFTPSPAELPSLTPAASTPGVELPSCDPDPATCNGPCDEDNDGDGYSEFACDCDDMDPEAFPSNPRADYPDGVDNDCDGMEGEACGYDPPYDFVVFWPADYDNDGDGYSEEQCDCRDDNPTVYPGSQFFDVPNGVDEDCDGLEGEDDDIAPSPTPALGSGETTDACTTYGTIPCFGPCDEDDDGDGWTEEQCDCADYSSFANPGIEADYIDGLDNDCDGVEGEDGESPNPNDPENRHSPTMPVVAIDPPNPTNNDDLNCYVERESHDLDGDTVTYAYRWMVDEVETAITSPTVSHEATTIGQEWTCVVTPSDGIHLGESGQATAAVSRLFQIDMKFVHAGSFQMGSPSGNICQFGNETVHTVTLTHDYWIGTTEVTQAQFEYVMGYNPSFYCGCDDCPVESMTWHEAAKFANELSRLDGIDPCYACTGEGDFLFCEPPTNLYDCYGYRLPTEAEWEYAARAGETADFSNGGSFTSWDQCDNCEDPLLLDNGTYLDEVLWYCNNSSMSQPVGLKPPNALGLFDVHGNIWEWCNDWWDGNTDYSGDAVDPVGAPFGTMKAARGGSWTSPPNHNQFPYRAQFDPTMGFENRGFRIVGLAFPGEDRWVDTQEEDGESTP